MSELNLIKRVKGGLPTEYAEVEGVKYITSVSDLPTPSAGVITISESSVTFIIIGTIDLVADRIDVTGDAVRFCGFGVQSQIISTNAGDIITATNTFTLELVQVIGLSATTIVRLVGVGSVAGAFISKNNFVGGSSTKIIHCSDYNNIITTLNAFVSGDIGIYVSGNINGFLADNNAFLGLESFGIDLDAAIIFAVGIDNNVSTILLGAAWLNIAVDGGNIAANGHGTVTNNKLRDFIDGVATQSLDTNGIGVGMTPGTYEATQFSTTDEGSDAVFNVTIDAVGSTTINSITTPGRGYIVGEDITLDISGETFSTRPIVNVDSIGDGIPVLGYSPFDLDWLFLGNNDITTSDRVSPTGWGVYADTATPVTDDIVVTTSDTQFTVDGLGGTTNEDYLPKAIRGIGSLWAGDLITPITEGDGLDLRVQFEIVSVTGSPSRIDLKLDIGGGGSIVIVADSKSIKNTSPQTVVFSFPIFALATFLANGGKINIAVDTGTANINSRTILLQRTSSGAT
jgi:hypothetical protein